LTQVIISMILVVNFCGENMSCEDIGEEYYMYVYPKTIEAAVALAKKKEKLEKYEGPGIDDSIEVETHLELLSGRSNVDPSDIASLTMKWGTNPCDEDEEKEKEMTKELREEFKKVGLNLDDYEYSFDSEYITDW